MTFLLCMLKPPRGRPMSNLTPSEILISTEAMSPLKRKAHFSGLSSENLKKIRLDPAPKTEDSTIIKYHERVRLLLPEDRDKLHICIPFEKELGQIQDLKASVDRLQQEHNRRREEHDRLREEHDRLRKKDAETQQRRLIMFQANALIDLARLLAKKCRVGSTEEHSTTKLQQFVNGVSDAQLTEMNIPRKVWPLLRKLDKFIARRNTVAHETKGDFAQLLLSNEFNKTHVFEVWKDIFPVLYGASVQDLAARQGAELAELLALSI